MNQETHVLTGAYDPVAGAGRAVDDGPRSVVAGAADKGAPAEQPAEAAVQPTAFVKGHGTKNDFVVIPDPDGSLPLTAEQVRALCDRRGGIGADGVIRVVPTDLVTEPAVQALSGEAQWFMDYRNADGSIAQMCGNGTRVFAAYLRRQGWERSDSFPIATRAGVKHVEVVPEGYAVNIGPWRLVDEPGLRERGFDTLVAVPGHDPMAGLSLDLGNPHVVVALPENVDLDTLDLTVPPVLNPPAPEGANVEFIRLLGDGHLRMRVHERGVGETLSCGTGAAAAGLAAMLWSADPAANERWQVDVRGGTVHVTALPDQGVILSGPAELVAEGTTTLVG